MNKDYFIKELTKADRLGRSSFGFFIETAKSKPVIKQLINDVENMSEEDIDNLQQRKWIKKQLKKLRNELVQRPDGALSPQEIANIMVQKSK